MGTNRRGSIHWLQRNEDPALSKTLPHLILKTKPEKLVFFSPALEMRGWSPGNLSPFAPHLVLEQPSQNADLNLSKPKIMFSSACHPEKLTKQCPLQKGVLHKGSLNEVLIVTHNPAWILI